MPPGIARTCSIAAGIVTRGALACRVGCASRSAMLGPVSDHPFAVPAGAAEALLTALDREGKIDRALEALGPLSGREAVPVDPGPAQSARWAAAGARLKPVPDLRNGA